jgi:excisionase family DNA binding protein
MRPAHAEPMKRDEAAWLTPGEIADELGVTPETVRRWIRERRLGATARQIGDRVTYRVTRSSYEAFLRSHVRDTLRDEWE